LSAAADADDLLRSDGIFVTRHRFTQTLSLDANGLLTDEGDGLGLHFLSRITTDFQRRVRVDSQDTREQEAVDLAVTLAYLTIQPVEGLDLTAGRLLDFGPLPALDLDGLRLNVRSTAGLTGSITGGREVRFDRSDLDIALFDETGGRFDYFDDTESAPDWLGQVDVGWAGRSARASFGHRLRFRDHDLSGQRSGLAVWGRTGLLASSFRGDFNHLMGSPDQLNADASITSGEGGPNLVIGWRYSRPVFDIGSIFNVFDIAPSVTWRMGVDLSPHAGSTLWANVGHRSFEVGGRTPWLGVFGNGGEPTAVNATIGGRFPASPTLRLGGSVDADAGYGGTLLAWNSSAVWHPAAHPARVGLRLRYLYNEDDTDLFVDELLATRLLIGHPLSSFGEMALVFEHVTESFRSPRLRLMVMFDFDVAL
jgi:hypothetical protein